MSTIVREVDADGDWTYGKGKNNYLQKAKAIDQGIRTALKEFLGDCFFDSGKGIDWFNNLGSKNLLKVQLDISSVILNVEGVTAILQLSVNLDLERKQTISYSADTIYTVVSGTVAIQ